METQSVFIQTVNESERVENESYFVRQAIIKFAIMFLLFNYNQLACSCSNYIFPY